MKPINQINIPFVAVHNKGLEINNISKTYNKKKVVNNVSIKLSSRSGHNSDSTISE